MNVNNAYSIQTSSIEPAHTIVIERPYFTAASHDINVELEVNHADIPAWHQVFTDGFHASFVGVSKDGWPQFQKIEIFDYLLGQIEGIMERSVLNSSITLSLPQLQCLIEVTGACKPQYRNRANFELGRKAEACEKTLRELVAPFKDKLTDMTSGFEVDPH